MAVEIRVIGRQNDGRYDNARLNEINLVFLFAVVFAKRMGCLLCRNKCCWYRYICKKRRTELTPRSYRAVVLKYLTTSFICAVYLQDNETPQLQWRLYSFVDKRTNTLRRLPKELPRFIFMTGKKLRTLYFAYK